MIIKTSPINFTKKDAVKIALNKLNQKSLIDILRKKIIVKEINVENVEMLYFPFWIGITENTFSSKIIKDSIFNILFAVEAFTGETRITLGVPIVEDKEIDDSLLVDSQIELAEVKYKIKKCAIENIMKKNRHIPEVKILAVEKIWKPTYIIPITYEANKKEKKIYRFVDAESGYVVYRYDLKINYFKERMKVFA